MGPDLPDEWEFEDFDRGHHLIGCMLCAASAALVIGGAVWFFFL